VPEQARQTAVKFLCYLVNGQVQTHPLPKPKKSVDDTSTAEIIAPVTSDSFSAIRTHKIKVAAAFEPRETRNCPALQSYRFLATTNQYSPVC